MLTREQKTTEIAAISERFGKAKAAFLVDFKGLNVEEVTSLRKNLRNADSEMRVIKNTLAKRALKDHPESDAVLSESFTGTNALVFAYSDVSASAKAISEFAKVAEELVVKMGVMEGRELGEAQITYLATLPPREVLQAQLLGTLQAPMAKFARVLNEVPSSFARVLNAYKEQKEA